MMRRWTAVLAASFSLAFATTAFADWKLQDNQWYYEQDGVNVTNGWKEIGGKWYFFKDTGVMAANEYVGAYYVGADGAWVEGHKQNVALTLDEVRNKNLDSYTAGRRSVYGPALNQGELDAVAQKTLEIVGSHITTDMDDMGKVKALYDYLQKNCTYAASWAQNRANTAWGALVYGEAQCSGYARGFKALCDAADIPCYYVHANEASINPSHQWNIVQVGGKWYHIDTQAGTFLVSDRVFERFGLEWNRGEFPACPESYTTIWD